MPKLTLDVVVLNAEGLHARPAMQFVDVTNRHAASVSVTKAGEGGGPAEVVDGKSVMGMMTLAAVQGTPLKIEADGDDAGAVCEALRKLFEDKFGEE